MAVAWYSSILVRRADGVWGFWGLKRNSSSSMDGSCNTKMTQMYTNMEGLFVSENFDSYQACLYWQCFHLGWKHPPDGLCNVHFLFCPTYCAGMSVPRRFWSLPRHMGRRRTLGDLFSTGFGQGGAHAFLLPPILNVCVHTCIHNCMHVCPCVCMRRLLHDRSKHVN